jgi:transcriptional regulator with XRE-family HTH domain
MGSISVSAAVAANLRAEIGRRGWSGQDFGRRVGWSHNTTMRKLKGKSLMTVDDLDRAAQVLGIELVALFQSAA